MNYPAHKWVTFPLVGLVLSLIGCSTKQLRESADKQVYGLIGNRSVQVPDMDRRFTIQQTNELTFTNLPVSDKIEDFLQVAAATEKEAHVVSLEAALGVAVKFNRTYQTRKEQLYLTALTLTLVQHRFTPLFNAAGTLGVAGGAVPSQTVEFIADPLDPSKPKAVFSDDLVEQTTAGGRGTVRVDWLLRDVGRISAAIVADFTRFFSGGAGTLTSSQISATLVRPLLRNAGFLAEMDLLTQAEHDLLYGVRDFTQYRKQFTVDIASEYYGVLGARDQVRNYFRNYSNSVQMNERASALAREGRTTQTEMGRFEQQVLDAESNWINAIRAYKQSLDGFKVRLGTSADTRIVLNEQDLSTLTIRHPDIRVEDAIQVALKARLDYQNALGRVDDAERRVKLAIDNLKPQLDLVAGVTLSSDPNKTSGFAYPELQRYQWNAGLDVDIPLDRLEKRNIYRSSLINEAQAERAVTQLTDDIGLEVRDNWRLLEQARRTYEISEAGVKLAGRRVEEQNLLAELGRAKALDQVDAQNSLLSSQNQRTQALVGHTIARLRFWNSMGILYVKDNGQWKEIPDAVR